MDESERAIAKLTESRKYLNESEQQNYELRLKLDKIQQQMILLKTQNQQPDVSLEQTADIGDVFSSLEETKDDTLSFIRQRRPDRFLELEKEEAALKSRLHTFKQNLKMCPSYLPPAQNLCRQAGQHTQKYLSSNGHPNVDVAGFSFSCARCKRTRPSWFIPYLSR